MLERKTSWIDGKPLSEPAGTLNPTINPANGEVLALIADATAEEVDSAVRVAERLFVRGDWRKMPTSKRSQTLISLANLIRTNAEELAQLESKNAGKTIADARDEIQYGANILQFFAGILPAFCGETAPVSGNGTGLVFREPVGVCGLIVPWNFPFVVTLWKVAPALAMGNSVVLKPAPATPLTALRLAELAQEAGIPDGVLNVVFGGAEVGRALSLHPLVRKISFTGSTKTGKEVMKMAAEGVKRVSLELGGKSASLVFADADVERAANSIWSVFANAGQDCCARSRMLVQREVYDRFVECFVEHTRSIRIGNPQADDTQMGCLISSQQRERVAGYVAQGKSAGAKLCLGGEVPKGEEFDRGSFYLPTVFSEVTPDMVIAQEEIFGPVVSILPFDTEEEGVALANGTPYGLSGSVWTRDIARALRVARAVESGVISINTSSSVHLEMPFGGFKQSGMGRELSSHALEYYSELKSVFISAE